MLPVAVQGSGRGSSFWTQDLEDTLDTLIDFIGATAGWIGLGEPGARLVFPVRRGVITDAWLRLQQGHGVVWGFALGDKPTRYNDLPPVAALGDPPVYHLLTCPMTNESGPCGQIVLANKVGGFTAEDEAAIQITARQLSQRLSRYRLETPARWAPERLLREAYDRDAAGILLFAEDGTLLFANQTWCEWTGYSGIELENSRPPFPF